MSSPFSEGEKTSTNGWFILVLPTLVQKDGIETSRSHDLQAHAIAGDLHGASAHFAATHPVSRVTSMGWK